MKRIICLGLSMVMLLSLIIPVSAETEYSYYVFAPESFTELGSWFKTGDNAGSTETVILRKDSGSEPATVNFKTGYDTYWNVYIHTRDYDATTNRSFGIGINGSQIATVGNHGNNGWLWESAGIVPLVSGEHTLSLIPIKSYSRCDYIIITDDPSFSPDSISDLKAFKTENLYSDEKVKYPEAVRPDTEFALSVNGSYSETENEMYLSDEALMLPCSEVMELLGFSPVFNSENASVVIPKNGYAIEAVAGSDALLYRGGYKLMSRKAEMKNGVLYVPVDFFAVALNGVASYDSVSKTAKILYDEKDASLYVGVDNFLLSPGTWYKDSDDTLRSSSVNSTTAVAANTSFKIDVPGTYTLFIKSFDSATTIANRKFHAILDSNTLETALGQHGTEGHAWTKVGSYNLEKGNHTLGLYNTSGSPHARFSGAFLTLDESHALPETDEEITNFKVPDSALELSGNASYPVWATLNGTALSETYIENDHVKLSFITESIGDKTVIKSEFYLKTADGLKVMKDKNENNGFLMLRADQSTANGRNSSFEAKNTQTINGVTGNVENYYKQGTPTWFIPSGITKVSDSEVKLTFDEGDATLTATYKLDTLTSDPNVTLDASFNKDGAYSFVLANGSSVSENSFDTVTAPFFYVKSEAPKTAGALPESYLFTPMATLETDNIVNGIAMDPSSVGYDVAYPETSKFGLLLRAPDGGVQPQFVAPLFGTEHAVFDAADTFSVSFRLIYKESDWFEAFKHVSQNLYNLKDLRTNEYTTSLNDAIYNTTDLIMNDYYGGFDENAKSFYNMEAPDVVTLANASEIIQRYLLTENEELLSERTIPTLAFMLTRNSHFNAGTTSSKYTPDVPVSIGTPEKTFPAVTLLGLSDMAGGRIPYLEEYGMNYVSSGTTARQVENYAYLYRKTGESSYLSSLISCADTLLANSRNNAEYEGTLKSVFIFTEYVPELSAFITAYEHTKDQKYLNAAQSVAQLLSTALRTTGYHDGYADENITVTPEDLTKHTLSAQNYSFFWHGSEKFRPGYSLDEKGNPSILDESLLYTKTLPGWTMARTGMGTEQKVSCVNGVAITMNTWASLFLRLSEYTGDSFYETMARNAIVGRFSNYTGYGYEMLAPHLLDADYPIEGPDVTSIYYHHLPPFLAMLEDFLITSVWAKSDGKIEFPSYTDTGYAYFHSRQYGGEAGKFYDEDDMWLWLDRGILTSSSKNTDYIAARKDGVLGLSFVNEGNESESVTITLGEKAPSYTGKAILIDADGTKSEISVENGVFTLNLPAKGLKSVIINSDEVSAPKHAASPMTVDESATSSVHTGGKGYVLQLDNSRYFAYTYITDKPDTVKSASITYTAGDKTETLTDSVYPYEFIVEVESPYTPFEYEITATLTDDSKDARGKAVLRPVNYTEFPEILNETSNGGLITANIGNASATPENSQIFLALFDSNKNLLQSEIKSISASDTSVEFKTYNLDFATAKLFLWNNMRPLCEFKSFNRAPFSASYEEFEPFAPTVSTVGRTGTHWRFVVSHSNIPFEISENSMTGMAITITFTPKAGGTAKTYDAYISSNEIRTDSTGSIASTVIVVPESTEFPTSDEWAVDHTQTIKIYPY